MSDTSQNKANQSDIRVKISQLDLVLRPGLTAEPRRRQKVVVVIINLYDCFLDWIDCIKTHGKGDSLRTN